MKKLAVVFAVLMLLVASSAAYAGQFGAPEPTAKEGKVALGVGYFHFSAKWKPKDADKTDPSSGTNDKIWREVKSNQNQAYLQLSYGFMKNAEVYIRGGAADEKVKNAFETGNRFGATRSGFKSDLEDGYKPFGTIGAKGVFNISDSFGIGPFVQASFYSSYEDSASGTAGGIPETQKIKVSSPWEVDLGLGLQGKIGGAIIYGGPVVYWAKQKNEWTGKLTGGVYTATGTDTYTVSTTYKEKGNVGGFAGLRVPLSKSLGIEVEGQYKSEFSFGGALTYAF